MRYEVWLGLRYLFARRRERFISIIAALSIGGVALGVTALLVVLAVMSGYESDMKDKLIGTKAHLIVDTETGVRETAELMRRLSAMDHVVGVSPFVEGQGILRLPDRAFGVLLRGIDVEREARVNRLADYVVMGRLPEHDGEVAIGVEMASMVEVTPGEALTVISPADGKSHTWTVSGLFRSGMYEYDAYLMATTLAQAQDFYDLEGLVTGIGVKLDTIERGPEIQRLIQRVLGPGYRIRSWMQLNPTLFGAIQVEKTVMFIILMLIIVVAALNIMSMLIMMVMEKTKDIGILRALGATRGSIATLFFSQGCAIGALGIVLGLAGGVALTLNLNAIVKWVEQMTGWALFPPTIYYLDYIPTQINASDVAAVVTAAFVLAAAAGTYAAVRAASLSPVDALRYE